MKHNENTPSLLRVAVITIFVALLDQLSKTLILKEFSVGEVDRVIPGFFNLTLTFNYGAAFGLWGGLPDGIREIVLGISITLALSVVWYFLRHPSYKTSTAYLALSCILGGALGNVVDRVTRGAVVDFLDVYYGSYHWPAFNLADSAICLGVFLLVLTPQKNLKVELL